MRLATFNVESLFDRPRAMSLENWDKGKPILDDFARLNKLIQENTYTDSIKTELLAIMKRDKGLLSRGVGDFIRLRENHGKLLRRPQDGPVEIRANGRKDWVGWFELIPEAIKETAIENTARVIDLLKTDVLCVIEAESRPALKHFNDDILPRVNAAPFGHVMVLDGNDERGIDVGIMTRPKFTIERIVSHVDDKDATGTIFSRDCAEYEIKTERGETILLLVNHLKSKGYGKPQESNAKRLRQATRVREIYDAYVSKGYQYIAVAGDLNEVPGGSPLAPLSGPGSPMTDVMSHPRFAGDGRPGTYGTGNKSGKLDYILMSPALSNKVRSAGIERRGVWGGTHGDLFPHLDTIKKEIDAASDHAALWVELDV